MIPRYTSLSETRRRRRLASIPHYRGAERLISEIRKVRISRDGEPTSMLELSNARCSYNPYSEQLDIIALPDRRNFSRSQVIV